LAMEISLNHRKMDLVIWKVLGAADRVGGKVRKGYQK